MLITHPLTPERTAQLESCRSIYVRNLRLNVKIGVYDHEKFGAQPMVFNVVAYVKRENASPTHDGLDEVVDYDFIRNSVVDFVHAEHVQLQETLCDKIAQQILTKKAIVGVYIASAKTDIYRDCDAIGVGAWYF
jgi:dihydroneopterin aldolase